MVAFGLGQNEEKRVFGEEILTLTKSLLEQ